MPRKTIAMLIAVTVPPETTAREARKEVRALINDQCNYNLDPGDVRLRKIGWVRTLGLGVKKLTFSFVGERDAQVRGS